MLVARFSIGIVIVGILFIAIFLFNRKHRFLLNSISAIIVILYCIISIIITRVKIDHPYPTMPKLLSEKQYSIFLTSYLTQVITILISSLLMYVSYFYSAFIKKQELQTGEEKPSFIKTLKGMILD